MDPRNNEPASGERRMPGWVILIPVTAIVGLVAWFIVANAGR